MTDFYESERETDREGAAQLLRALADGVQSGTVRLGSGDDAMTVDLPDDLVVEVDLASEDDGLELEVEIEVPGASEAAVTPVEGGPDETATDVDLPVGAVVSAADSARFELFTDAGGEWRWRLVHRNGNVIADGGEGYGRKASAEKGLRSVARNAPDAEVVEITDD